MSSKLYFTRKGLAKLQREVAELEKKLKELQSQTAHLAEVGGDQYHDNASYESLVIDIRGIDWRLTEAHRALRNAVIVESPTNVNKISIGTRVKLVRDGKEMSWSIAGFGESDPNNSILAYNAPLATLIIGKQEGEVVNGNIAGRETEIEILEISKG